MGTWSSGEATARTSAVALAALRRPASLLSRAIPVIMIVVGLAVAVPAAIWAERPSGEGPGSFGLEAGAALWFGGALAFSLRTTTARRALLVVMTAAVGAALIVVALSFGWSGAALALAMEFGVGALAVLVIDVIVLGAIQPALEALARPDDRSVRADRLDRADPEEQERAEP